ncbi:MAG TPA: hypothetical protein ENJ18_03830, partial [Nannocystis exedens]|nr:hypothetical protein [Nannocystis exedens]
MLYKPSHGVHATSSEDCERLSLTASLVTISAEPLAYDQGRSFCVIDHPCGGGAEDSVEGAV